MVKSKLDKEVKKAILNARKMMQDVSQEDGNEAETRRRVERIFEFLMGYNTFENITREHAIQGVGDVEHCDFAIVLDKKMAKPEILVELKRVNVDLNVKHLKQAASYAINIGCEWVLLTNGKEWKLYHILFGQPPQTKLVDSWNLMTDEPAKLVDKFDLISYKNVKKSGLTKIWEKTNVLTAQNILKIILSESSLSMMRREIKKLTGVAVSPEDVVSSIRYLLNEAAGTEMNNIRILLPGKNNIKKAAKSKPPESC